MSWIRNIPLFTIVLSLFSGPLCMMLSAQAARKYTIAYESVLTAACAAVLYYTYRTGEAFTYVMGEFPAPWGNEIRAGALEGLMAVTFAIILLCSLLGGRRFIEEDIDHSKQNLYYTLVNLLTAALMALIWTNDIFTGYVFLEILTLTSCGLLIVREIGRTTLAAARYMILNLMGSGLFLLGVVLLYDITGQLLMVPMRQTLEEMAQDPDSIPIIALSLGVLTIGLAIKSGLFPFHFWMPDTYGWATPSSASILSSLVSKAYILLLFKIYYRSVGMDVVGKTPILKILFVLGIAGMLFGSVCAILTNTISRMVAFSSAAQVGYIFMGISLGGLAGMAAAMFQILAHAVTKSMLFLTIPHLSRVSGDSLLFKALQGSAHRSKKAGVFFTIGGLSMMGIPTLAGFTAKLAFAEAAYLRQDNIKMMIVMVALSLSSLLNALYFVRTIIRIWADSPQHAEDIEAVRRGEKVDLHKDDERVARGEFAAQAVLTTLNLILGMCSVPVMNLIYIGLAMYG